MLNFSSLKDRKTGTPNRRLSVNHTSPNAGTIIYRPTSQSPANIVSTNVGNEFNTTLVGSNNISLNKVICLVFRRFKQYLIIFFRRASEYHKMQVSTSQHQIHAVRKRRRRRWDLWEAPLPAQAPVPRSTLSK